MHVSSSRHGWLPWQGRGTLTVSCPQHLQVLHNKHPGDSGHTHAHMVCPPADGLATVRGSTIKETRDWVHKKKVQYTRCPYHRHTKTHVKSEVTNTTSASCACTASMWRLLACNQEHHAPSAALALLLLVPAGACWRLLLKSDSGDNTLLC